MDLKKVEMIIDYCETGENVHNIKKVITVNGKIYKTKNNYKFKVFADYCNLDGETF